MNSILRTTCWWLFILLCGLVPVFAGGCAGSGENALYKQLQSDDPRDRIQAMIRATEINDQQAVPLIVENLGNSESDVRLFAVTALQKLTGQTMGYEFYAPRNERQQAIERWRQWLKDGRKTLPTATAPAGTTAPTSATAPASQETQPS